jgi:hypothetical protein
VGRKLNPLPRLRQNPNRRFHSSFRRWQSGQGQKHLKIVRLSGNYLSTVRLRLVTGHDRQNYFRVQIVDAEGTTGLRLAGTNPHTITGAL